VSAEPVDTVAPELRIAGDMARKSLLVAAVLVLGSALVWGLDGALSSAYSVVLVVLNFVAAAALISWGAPRGGNHLMAAVLGGYLLRLGVLTAAIVLVKDASWVERAPLFITLLVTHVGLLIWETRSVSLSLAYPGLKPRPAQLTSDDKETATR
jgi:F0F1-type ATP synthase assembly protein I